MGFDIAKRGIMTAQKGLDISGQNLVNWDSAGYTRQRLEQVAVAPNVSATRYSYNRAGLAGQGVEINGISQTRDKFLDKRFREENAETGYYDKVNNLLGDIESTIDELKVNGDSGIRYSLKEMMDSLSTFSKDAYSETYANIVMNTFKNMAQTLQQLSMKLDNVASQQKFDLSVSVQDFNQLVQKLAAVNKSIGDDVGASLNPHFGPNELLDERNLLLDELSKYGEIEVRTNSDSTVTVTMNGHTVVDRAKYDQLEMFPDPNSELMHDSTVPVEVRWVSTNQQAEFKNGIIKGFTDFINGAGPAPGEGQTSKRGIPYYQAKLDTFAQTLADTVNGIIPDTTAPEIQAQKQRVDDLGAQESALNGLLSTYKSLQAQYDAAVTAGDTAKQADLEQQWDDLVAGYKYPDAAAANKGYTAPTLTLGTTTDAVFDPILGNTAAGITGTLIPGTQQYKDMEALKADFQELNKKYAAAQAAGDTTYINSLKDKMDRLVKEYNDKGYQNTNIDTGITGLGGVNLADGAAGVTQVETAVNAELADVKALKQTHVEALDTMIANAPKKKLYGSIDGGPINAQNLTITDDWNGNPSYVISILDSKQNNALNQLINALNADKISFQSRGELVESTFSDYVTGYSTTLAEDKNYYYNRLEATTVLNNELQDRRDEVSGVVVDEEVANVMLYNKSLSAASRLMTALDEALDVLINRTGRVGL